MKNNSTKSRADAEQFRVEVVKLLREVLMSELVDITAAFRILARDELMTQLPCVMEELGEAKQNN